MSLTTASHFHRRAGIHQRQQGNDVRPQKRLTSESLPHVDVHRGSGTFRRWRHRLPRFAVGRASLLLEAPRVEHLGTDGLEGVTPAQAVDDLGDTVQCLGAGVGCTQSK